MATSDKAVSTDDFSINLRCSESLGLQTILRALVQQKVEALKGNGDSIKTPSTQSSSSPIIKRLRVLSTSSVSLHDNSNLESRNKGSQKSSGERHAKRTLKNAEDTAEIGMTGIVVDCFCLSFYITINSKYLLKVAIKQMERINY